MQIHRVLFISHDAHRTGAPILLLNLIKALKVIGHIHVEALLKQTGVLQDDFKAEVPTTLLDDWLRLRSKQTLFNRKEPDRYEKLKQYVLSFEMVVSNTITNGDLDEVLRLHPNVVTYVHELEQAIQYYTTEENLRKVLSHSRYFLYPSEEVRRNLVENHAVSPDKFIFLPYYIPDVYEKMILERAAVREELGVAANETLIIGIGTNDWRKGADLFLTSMQLLFEKSPLIKAIWVGSNTDSVNHVRMLSDLRKMKLDSRFQLIPSTPNPFRFLAAADLFFLSSREDPYPLVVIESAMMKLPCVYFPESGGAKEFIAEDSGIAVPYGNTNLASIALFKIVTDAGLQKLFSENARKKYLRLHSREVISRHFQKIVSAYILN